MKDGGQKVIVTDLAALEDNFQAVDSGVAAANGAERCARFERPSVFKRLDSERLSHSARSVAAEHRDSADTAGANDFTKYLSQPVAEVVESSR
jgi:hypothetical protein